MYNFRTDLAVERREILEKQKRTNGIETEEKEINDNLKVTKVKVTNKDGEEAIRKTNAEHM